MVLVGTGENIGTLTTIFLGLAVLAVGLYFQTQPAFNSPYFWNTGLPTKEGFQESTVPVPAPAATSMEILSPPSVASTTLDDMGPEDEGLKRKVAEIRTMYAAIKVNKPKQDITLNGLLDAELLNTLDTIVE